MSLVTLPDSERRQDCPWIFYRVTDEGYAFLKGYNLPAAEETLQQISETIDDKPEKLVKYETAPRPEEV